MMKNFSSCVNIIRTWLNATSFSDTTFPGKVNVLKGGALDEDLREVFVGLREVFFGLRASGVIKKALFWVGRREGHAW